MPSAIEAVPATAAVDQHLELEIPNSEDPQDHACSDAFQAVRLNHVSCLKMLDNNTLLAKDSAGETALHHAARGGLHDIIAHICKAVPSLRQQPSSLGEVPAHISAAANDEKALQLLLDGPLRETIHSGLHRDLNGTSLLMAAIARGYNYTAIKLLKKFGKSIAILPNNSLMLPIHVAAAQGNIDFLKVVVKFDNSMVHSRDEFGCTPLVYAVQAGCLTSVKFLVEHGKAQIGTVNKRGQSLLHVAALCGHEHVARWLLNRTGSDAISWRTADNATAVHCAAYSGSVPVLRLFLSEFNAKKCRAVLSQRDARGNSPLHLAAINNHIEAAMFMLENGADAELVNAGGHSAQGIAAVRGHTELVDKLKEASASNSKKKKKMKKIKPAKSTSDISSSDSPPISPLQIVPPATASMSPMSASMSPNAMSPKFSSGYSSASDVYVENGGTVIERHRMRYVEDGEECLQDGEVQTDEDGGTRYTMDDTDWQGLGLSAVEHIDRVLDEVV